MSISDFFHTSCLFCLAPASIRLGLCEACFASLPWLKDDNSCPRCALPSNSAQLCAACQKGTPAFQQSISAVAYAWPVDRMIYAIKQQYHKGYIRCLGTGLLQRLQQHYQSQWPQYLVAIPLHHRRFLTRGYNQSMLLAQYLSKHTQVPVFPHVKRRHNTPSQRQATHQERRANVRQAFTCPSFKAPHVAIVDDVVTTGATVNAMARTLRKAGVKRVDVWSLARTPLTEKSYTKK